MFRVSYLLTQYDDHHASNERLNVNVYVPRGDRAKTVWKKLFEPMARTNSPPKRKVLAIAKMFTIFWKYFDSVRAKNQSQIIKFKINNFLKDIFYISIPLIFTTCHLMFFACVSQNVRKGPHRCAFIVEHLRVYERQLQISPLFVILFSLKKDILSLL